MKIHQWKGRLFGILLLALIPLSQASAAGLSPAGQALVAAGDVDGVAAMLASSIAAGQPPEDIMAEIASQNPDIAGAVLNATVRSLRNAGISAAALAPTLKSLAAGAMVGTSSVVTAAQAQVYAENIATNVRQAVAVVSGGNTNQQNALLASARAGVAQSASAVNSASGQILRSDVSVRLQGGLSAEELTTAQYSEPVIVYQDGSDTTTQPTTQQTQSPATQQSVTPVPVVNPTTDPATQENPQVDIPSASPT